MIEKNSINNNAAEIDAQADALAASDTAPPAPAQVESSTESQAEAVKSTPAEVFAWLDMGLSLFEASCPGLRAIYTPGACAELAYKGAALLNKYDMSMPDFLSRWREEVEFAFVALPLGYATVVAARSGALTRIGKKSDKPGETNVTYIRPEFGPVPDPETPPVK